MMTDEEMREDYARLYAYARDPYLWEFDIDEGRARFDAWLASHDADLLDRFGPLC